MRCADRRQEMRNEMMGRGCHRYDTEYAPPRAPKTIRRLSCRSGRCSVPCRRLGLQMRLRSLPQSAGRRSATARLYGRRSEYSNSNEAARRKSIIDSPIGGRDRAEARLTAAWPKSGTEWPVTNGLAWARRQPAESLGRRAFASGAQVGAQRHFGSLKTCVPIGNFLRTLLKIHARALDLLKFPA
jgi:hypothetical protein